MSAVIYTGYDHKYQLIIQSHDKCEYDIYNTENHKKKLLRNKKWIRLEEQK
jgi:hypothetical protein